MTLTATVRRRLSPTFDLVAEFQLEAGVTILFGASGSGKTTLLRCLAGLTRPESGRITIGGRVLFDADAGVAVPARHRGIGYVFQQLALFPHLSIGANIEYGLSSANSSERRQRSVDIARSFGIDHLLTRRPSEISGGERQRAALARSLVTTPSLLLLDEPLSALDYATQSRIIADLRAWNDARQIPILYVTHAHREVFALGERVLVLDRGRIVGDGTPQSVMETPVEEAMAQMAGFENLFDARVIHRSVERGTMECRIANSEVELEVPLVASVPTGDVRLAIRAGDILLATEAPRGLSARNVIPGLIRSLKPEGSSVVAMVDAGHLFEVHLTIGAVTALALTPQLQVWLVMKTHSFRRVN